MSITTEERTVLLKARLGEPDALKLYNAPVVKAPRDADRLAAEEQRHGDTVPGLL